MTDREREQLKKPSIGEVVFWIILTLFLISTLTGCKTTRVEVPVEVPVTHTEYINKYDSIYMHDSIYLDRYTKNDTVYFNKYVYRDKYRYKTDTLRVNDSISVPVYITKTEYTNRLYWWQKTLIFTGISSILALIIYIIIKLKL